MKVYIYDIDYGSKSDNFAKTKKEISEYSEQACGYGTGIRAPMEKLNGIIIKVPPKLKNRKF